VLNRAKQSIVHDVFRNLGSHLRPGDLLVANRSRVIPARLRARRVTGGAVEFLLLRRLEDRAWSALARPSRRLNPGDRLPIVDSSLVARLEEYRGVGEWRLRLEGAERVDEELFRVGRIPLPPYIRSVDGLDERYQTIYADQNGSVAAPTAGLHFTTALFQSLSEMQVDVEFVTLHVGPGTFRTVQTAEADGHHMHPEWGEITADTAAAIARARMEGRRIIAIGTTTTRLLEAAACNGSISAFSGDVSTFILPGFRFGIIDGILTNFHLPRSTLLMLISAFAGRDYVLRAYSEAIKREYRFYSFGDAMLVV
jgi:S-adenosylmethionine:tRNA ribosyltransferase-isomerase